MHSTYQDYYTGEQKNNSKQQPTKEEEKYK